MLFSSIPFLYYFLPITLLLYFIAPKKLKNSVLLLMSLVFYAWGGPKYLILMITSILIGYVFGILVEKAQSRKVQKVLTIVSVSLELSLLLYLQELSVPIVLFLWEAILIFLLKKFKKGKEWNFFHKTIFP